MAEATQGHDRRSLNELMVFYATRRCIPYSESWQIFGERFFKKHHTRLGIMRRSYEQDSGRKLTMPEFLVETGWMEQAIRIAEEMTYGEEQTTSGKAAAGSCPEEETRNKSPCVQHPA